MIFLRFIREAAALYFSENIKSQRNIRYVWSFLFIGFFSLYLLQIYAAYINWQEVALAQSLSDKKFWDLEAIWQVKLDAAYLQGIVLGGVFIKFGSSHFGGRWAIRFGEVGELIAFAAFCRHFFWSREVLSNFVSCSSEGLIGTVPFAGQLIGMFLLFWLCCKVSFLIAVVWKAVRR